MIKIALYGRPGAGKSTFSELLYREIAATGVPVVPIKLAAPLYALQGLIHVLAGCSLPDPGAQDGLLLNDLGHHMRRINPGALTDPFARRVAQVAEQHPNGMVVCDDMRGPDVDALLDMGFTLVEVWAPEDVRRARKQIRGDLSPGAEDHPTEVAPTCDPSHRIVNDDSLEHLRLRAAEFARKVLA
ncbi:hypothetical protein ACGFIV_31195 [Sphaerisporangium sp. NPDC049003]|uniref:hypothetical protein n=1 Tax=Sphaerisporangium sp. NPDC049003 TaxID=3364517 RepID=UPI003719E62D